jgi:NADH-ubiquinone oxidoreductase chain 6
MYNLFNVVSAVCNGFSDIILDILAVLSVLFGISVINSKNPIVSVLFLIGLFLSISLNLILLGYNFIGLSYLLVYVGAVSILFLFILMLINVRISELVNDTSNSIPLAIFTGITLGFPLYSILNNMFLCFAEGSEKNKYINKDLSYWFNSETFLLPPFSPFSPFSEGREAKKENGEDFSTLDEVNYLVKDELNLAQPSLRENNNFPSESAPVELGNELELSSCFLPLRAGEINAEKYSTFSPSDIDLYHAVSLS